MSHYIRHSIADTDFVLAAIYNYNSTTGPSKQLINGVLVNVKSLRLNTFATKGLVCANCGIFGSIFALERIQSQPKYHINLWAVVNDIEILMTHDHIIARCNGGLDDITNVQTMCSPCNYKKSLLERPKRA